MAIAFDIQHGDGMTDDEYDGFLGDIGDRFRRVAESEPLFTTNNGHLLWDIYLNAFPLETRQYHNCNTCRAFIERFGSLVWIDGDGRKRSAVWNGAQGTIYEEPFAKVRSAVEADAVRIEGVFLSSDKRLGERRKGLRDKSLPDTPDNTWSHLFVDLPDSAVYRGRVSTAYQAACEKSEDYRNVSRALAEFSLGHLEQAEQLLKFDSLYRSEKVLGPVAWLRELNTKTTAEKHAQRRQNIVWRAIATAPAGFCHPRSSMAGTLLEDLATGNGFDWAARRFASKMHPLQYQRPQAAPNDGQIAAAEKLVEKLGIAPSLERRFARLDELEVIWKPSEPMQRGGDSHGVFGHLKKEHKQTELRVPSKAMTWEKFADKVLPEAKEIELLVQSYGNYCAYLTSVNADDPPILQWDSEEQRNPVSLYVYNGGSPSSQWKLTAGSWVRVNAISLRPSQWHGGKFEHHSDGALLVLDGCVDMREDQGNALFPEVLKSELHGARPVIEAFSKRATIHGRDAASACGYMIGKNTPVELRVVGPAGIVSRYKVDRLE